MYNCRAAYILVAEGEGYLPLLVGSIRGSLSMLRNDRAHVPRILAAVTTGA